jgi:hypothetical protein
MTTNAYLIYWCNEGLESVTPITQYEKWNEENTFRILKDEPTERNPLTYMIQMMTMRARFNPDRHYELYAIDCEENITKEQLEQMFENDPQTSADLIRNRGHRLFSHRAEPNKVKIV